ncbi:hypothetical protein TeGR_g2510 [Tetraparma gracilis]|uniref:Uncharacterized protein n=1 Tax=Tetraparma gracilis TaxID=2962635 RepID=A0ABQ6MGA7_9STRA|nr:hypothetical protein TeGR_g2510 [Tetraparma gracilis]
MPFGDTLRAAVSSLIAILSPIGFLLAMNYLDEHEEVEADFLLCALLVAEGVAFSLMLKGRGGGKGTNLVMILAIPVLSVCLHMTLDADMLPSASPLNNTKAEVPDLMFLSYPPAPPLPPLSCQWFNGDSVEAASLPLNSYPDPSLLPSSYLRSSVCLDDFSEGDLDKIEEAIDALDHVAFAAGVTDDEWQKEECKTWMKRVAHLATTPYCSPSSCAPLGFCDSDCHVGREFCGRMATYDGVLVKALPGGEFHAFVAGVVGDTIHCVVQVLQLMSGGGDDTKICAASASTFSNMAFGSTPYVDCLPLSVDDPNTFLRDATSTGSCALPLWDQHGAEVKAVKAHNDALVLDATNTTAADESVEEEEPPPRFPKWRSPAVVLVPAVMFLLLWVGDRLSVTKETADSLATVTPVLEGVPTSPPPSSSSSPAKELNFLAFFGATGVFVATAQIAVGVFSMFLGFRAENGDGIPAEQIAALYVISLVAVVRVFDTVVYWRTLVSKLLQIKAGKKDPLEMLDKLPRWLKRLVRLWKENFAIESAGKYSFVLVVAVEVVEFFVQTQNASKMARYLDWKVLRVYLDLISANSVLFGVFMILPEQFVSTSGIIAVDVLIDATYIMYFKKGTTSRPSCGIGVDLNPDMAVWSLDLSWCGLEEFEKWREEYAGLEVLDLSNNELIELPGWLGGGEMGKLRELRARRNKIETFVDGMLGGEEGELELVDLRDNEIVELPYDRASEARKYSLMDVESKATTLLFDGNLCAEEVDWGELGVDRLPARMGVGYDNGGFSRSLRVLKMGRNELDESVFEELAAANYTRIEELDVSWNALGGVGEGVGSLEKLRKLDVSGNKGIRAAGLVAAPQDLEVLNASFCDVVEITARQAVALQDHNMTLHGNPVTRLEWQYQGELKKIPAWLRTLEKVTYANLEYGDVKEMQGGAFPPSLKQLTIRNQHGDGLRLHPDSFDGLPNLWYLNANNNKIKENDMHPGLFAGATRLRELWMYGNTEMRRFNATELFPGGSETMDFLHLSNCGLTEGTDFQGLKYSSLGSNAECESCDAGWFGAVVGSSSADDCQQCEAGFSTGNSLLPALVDLGKPASCIPNCGVGEGDCNDHDDCAHDLLCFHRDSSDEQVPGCAVGGSGDVGPNDYCYDPLVESLGAEKCGACPTGKYSVGGDDCQQCEEGWLLFAVDRDGCAL